MKDKIYAERDIEQLDDEGGYYCKHISAMTSEGLHGKSEIAAELAWRDKLIDDLTKENEDTKEEKELWRVLAGERAIENEQLKGQLHDMKRACPTCGFICPSDTPTSKHNCEDNLAMTVYHLKDHVEQLKAEMERRVVSANKIHIKTRDDRLELKAEIRELKESLSSYEAEHYDRQIGGMDEG